MERRPALSQSRTGIPAHARAAALALAVLASLSPSTASATHFRYGHITWQPLGGNSVEFTAQNVWRRDAYGAGPDAVYQSSENRCVDGSFATVACTGPNNYAGVGDLIHETQGSTALQFGDTSTFAKTIGSGGSARTGLIYYITSIDPVNNWAFGFAVDHTVLPTIDTTISHTYSGPGPWTAKIEDCCRISPCTSPNAHLNNPDNGYSVATTVDLSVDDSAPTSSVPPIVLCPRDGQCNFGVPVSDDEGDAVEFRLAADSEAHFDYGQNGDPPGLGQPGPPACPNAAQVSAGGDYTWDTHSCRLAGSPQPTPPAGGCNQPSFHSLYSTQVVLEETQKPATSAVDFLIEIVDFCPLLDEHSPAFSAPPLCGTARSVNPNTLLSFGVTAADGDGPQGDTLTLNAVGLPYGAAVVPLLPTSSDPVSTTFSWTPSSMQLGQHVITFTATDSCGQQALCVVTVDVSNEICGNGSDDDGDTLIDCADPDCNATPCDDGQFCTVNDTCQAGTCGGLPNGCSDGEQCTSDSCDENADACIHTPQTGTSCEDGNFCTSGDLCQNGSCIAGAAPSCDDGNSCTADSCNEGSNSCDHTALADETPCDDGAFCTEGDACTAGACIGGPARNCADGSSCTVDTCDENADACVHDGTSLEGTTCDDGLFCTGPGAETCQSGVCAGTSRDCADTNPCTVDLCDESGDQCSHSSGPATSCHKAGRAVLVVKDSPDAKKDKFVWRWLRGSFPAEDSGDPLDGNTDFTLCVYDDANAGADTNLVLTAPVTHGGTCARGKPCWKKGGSDAQRRFRYKDKDSNGLKKLVLKAGADGKARAIFVSRGDRATVPAPATPKFFQEDGRVRVQLVSSAGKCWEAEYTAPAIRNRSDLFRDKCGAGNHPACQ